MPADFVPGFADRLNRLSPAHVKVAVDGDILAPGIVYVAPGDDRHMRLASCTEDTSSLVRGPPICGHVPSVNALFQSLVSVKSRARCAILTGMGADGAEGLAEVLTAGGRTVAQSAENCIVFGMPREAIECGGADAVLPLEKIAHWLLQDVTDIRS
jgi:two-component system chemotaxis response regulator CheB